MAHDLLAELAGYTNELARVAGQSERAAAVREEVQRVRGEIAERVKELEAEATEHSDAGRDVRAAECAVAARSFIAALRDGELETAVESKPRRTATPSSRKSS